MRKEWDTIEVLKHARHDWLNKLQLIKGNLSLNKVDRVKEIIDEIIVEARQETNLTNLHLPQFAATLLTCNWDKHNFQLHYEINDSPDVPKLDDKLLCGWVIQLFEILDSSIERFQDNQLSVMIHSGEDRMRFFCDFSGTITDRSTILQFLEAPIADSIGIEITDVTEEELSFEFFTIPTERV